MPKWDYRKDIDYDAIDVERIKENDFLFTMLTIASFIEITSETYAMNLAEYYRDNPEAVAWLTTTWEKEEVQHGKALRAFVEHVWPEFPWERAYERFLQLYLPMCNLEALQPSQALEMVARMIVETGTSTLYRALESYATDLGEPQLAKLCHFIYRDEVNHYSYFDRYYKIYNEKEHRGRKAVLSVIVQRLKEADGEDIKMGFQAIYETRHDRKFDPEAFEAFHKQVGDMAKKYYPYSMAIKMMLHPLRMHKAVEATVTPVVRGALKVLGV
jgi:hypothetical protein